MSYVCDNCGKKFSEQRGMLIGQDKNGPMNIPGIFSASADFDSEVEVTWKVMKNSHSPYSMPEYRKENSIPYEKHLCSKCVTLFLMKDKDQLIDIAEQTKKEQ